MSTAVEPEPITAGDGEQVALEQLERLLESQCCAPQTIKLVGPQGEEIPLSAAVARVIREAVRYMRQDKAIVLAPVNRQLTTQQAADLLNVSRPYLIKLLEAGVIPFAKVGTHRRVRLSDVMDYKQRRDARRQAALDHLTQLNQEMGLYDSQAG